VLEGRPMGLAVTEAPDVFLHDLLDRHIDELGGTGVSRDSHGHTPVRLIVSRNLQRLRKNCIPFCRQGEQRAGRDRACQLRSVGRAALSTARDGMRPLLADRLPHRRADSISCQTLGGVSGNARGSTPNALSAAATALAITPPTEMIPPSPPPLAPRGLIGDGCVPITCARILGKSLAVGTR